MRRRRGPASDAVSAADATTGADDLFETIWRDAERISGWLTRDQAKLLFDLARALPQRATVLEIGSHQGRSSVVLGAAIAPAGGRLICVDPFVDGRLFGGSSTRSKFEANIDAAGLKEVVRLEPEYSTRLRPNWREPIDMLYIDGKHDYWTFTDDLRWAGHLPAGGPIAVHDCFSSIGVTLGILAKVLPSRSLTYRRRVGSLAVFVVQRARAADRLCVVRELPWWLRNVAIKIMLRLRLRPLARAFGHDSPYDPY